MRGEHGSGERKLRGIIILTERPDGLLQGRDAVFGSARRDPGPCQADGSRQLKDARLLLPRGRDGRFELPHGGIETAGIELKQAFTP
jgi:hypothetical protein